MEKGRSSIKILESELLEGRFSLDVVSHWHQKNEKAQYFKCPSSISPIIREIFLGQYPKGFYSQQVDSWNEIHSGKHVVVATSTSSGKSVCYFLPIFDASVNNTQATSMLLFPTKALARDQLERINGFLNLINQKMPREKSITAAVYDGDTQMSKRISIRNLTNIIITNPDMLHFGILPYHPSWERFFTNLKYIIIDEIHWYRGVFGSHFANVIRRLKRIYEFYGTNPIFILTSATISNVKNFAESLIEENIVVINSDTSPKENRHYFFLNPPIVNKELGLRKGMIDQAIEIADIAIQNHIQSIIFSRTRKTVELTVKKALKKIRPMIENMHGYRSGYLSTDRRIIEKGIREGFIKTVISTNALEMGIDMGKVDLIVMMGYHGSISSFLQQSGRAGRRNQPSVAILIASSSPLDQFIIRHDEFVRLGSPEKALIDANNPLIMLSHIRCAAFELPFNKSDRYGTLKWKDIKPYLDILCSNLEIYQSNDSFSWIADAYPAKDISLRNINQNPIALRISHTGNSSILIGEVDFQSAFKTVHPGAVYLQDGDIYLVDSLDTKTCTAWLRTFKEDYVTEPQVKNSIKLESIINSRNFDKFNTYFGELRIIEKVSGYKRIDWLTQQILGVEELDLPERELFTKGIWISFSKISNNELLEKYLYLGKRNHYGPEWKQIRERIIIRDANRCQVCKAHFSSNSLQVHHKIPFKTYLNPHEANNPSNLITLCPTCHRRVEQNVRIRSGLSGVAYLISNISPVKLMCDYRDLGCFCEPESEFFQKNPVICIYDQFPGGIGLSAALFEMIDEVLELCLNAIRECPCDQGCPSCVGPFSENGVGNKIYTEQLLISLLKK